MVLHDVIRSYAILQGHNGLAVGKIEWVTRVHSVMLSVINTFSGWRNRVCDCK